MCPGTATVTERPALAEPFYSKRVNVASSLTRAQGAGNVLLARGWPQSGHMFIASYQLNYALRRSAMWPCNIGLLRSPRVLSSLVL